MKDGPAIYALTPRGLDLGISINRDLHGEVFAPSRLVAETGATGFTSLSELVAETFHAWSEHVFIAAAGIAVRMIAPHLRGKATDPAVVVMDQDGTHVISLVSGHVGGANDLARLVAGLTGGTAVITTATDTARVPAADILARDAWCVTANPEAVKTVNAALNERRPVQVYDPGHVLDLTGIEGFFQMVDEPRFWRSVMPGVWVDYRDAPPPGGVTRDTLRLYPRCLHLGVGCRRGTQAEEILGLVERAFKDGGLSLKSVASLGSIDLKQDESGLLKAASKLGLETVFFSAGELAEVTTPNPSAMVGEKIGAESVSEASALLLSRGGRLLVEKRKCVNATVAVALDRSLS